MGNVITLRFTVLHYRTDAEACGGVSRKCSECGTRLWIPKDGKYTEDHRVWEKPPPGYVNCRRAREQEASSRRDAGEPERKR